MADDHSVIFAIESSCDETAVAVLRGYGELLAGRVHSQARIHAEYGGVVPEVASRNHLARLPEVIDLALADAKIAFAGIDAFAATMGPGLPAALLVGSSAAKGLAIGARRPFLAVNHIEGHLLSPFFGEATVPPHVGLVVSGGHTLLVDVEGFRQYNVLGTTHDDAAGEAFDKVAKLLGLGYPGGVEIDRLSLDGDSARYDFPRAMLHSGDFHFSFSGLKTAVRYLVEKEDVALADLCASFQEAVVEVLAAKSLAACAARHRSLLAVSGGVSANRRLRQILSDSAAARGLAVRFAPRRLCTDNAAMIAYAAAHQWAAGLESPLDSDIAPNLDSSFIERTPPAPGQTV